METWRRGLTRDGVEVVPPRIPIRRKHAPEGEGPREKQSIQSSFDGHGFYYVDFARRAVVRDTELGAGYTAESILHQTGLDKELERLALNRRLELQPKQRTLLERTDPDPRQKVQLLLELSQQHDQIIANRQTKQELRQQHQLRMSL
jgi:hypothetical protein